jgi:hypothetical protein
MDPLNDHDEIQACFGKYRDYLESIEDRLPENACKFATADWYYNPEDHRCPRDSWVESFLIEEPSTGERREERWINIKVRLIGSYHDGHIELTHERVSSYSLSKLLEENVIYRDSDTLGHGDWLYDEIRLLDNGSVIHEVILSNNYQWFIECQDISYEWQPS